MPANRSALPPVSWPPESEWPAPDRPLWSLERILAKLDDPRPAVREWAMRRLRRRLHPEIERRMAELLGHPDPKLWRPAARWIEEYGTPASADAVVAALARSDVTDPSSLGDAAVRWAPERAVPILEKKLESPADPYALIDTCILLGRAGWPKNREFADSEAVDLPGQRLLGYAAAFFHDPSGPYRAGAALVSVLCTLARVGAKRLEKNEYLFERIWRGWEEGIETVPADWVEPDMEAFSAGVLAKLLHDHGVTNPRRFAEILRPDGYAAIRRAWNKQEICAAAIAELAAAIEAALSVSEGRGTAGFETLAGRVRGLAEALRKTAEGFSAMPSFAVRRFIEHALAVLLKACHGRLLAEEIEARRGSLEGLMDLNEIDLPFVEDALPRAIADLGAKGAGEAVIARVARGADDHPTLRALAAAGLLARDPAFDRDRAAAAVVPLLATDWDAMESVLEAVLPRIGDPLLHRIPLADDDRGGNLHSYFIETAREIATERSLYFVRHFLARLRAIVRPVDLAAHLSDLAHPSILPALEELAAAEKAGRTEREALDLVRMLLEED